MNKLPPIEKVYEAWSAIADDRVHLDGDTATVTSSDGTKTYTIKYDAVSDTYASNDNATFWRGYAGYPVLAVLMLTGRLPYDKAEASQWAGINWTRLNAEYKRDYSAAVSAVEQQRGTSHNEAEALATKTMEALSQLPIKVKRLVKTD